MAQTKPLLDIPREGIIWNGMDNMELKTSVYIEDFL